MRKQESIHLHGLLAEVVRYLDEHEGMPAGALDEYAKLETRPLSVTHSKDRHCEALLVLAGAVEAWIERPEKQDAPAQ